MITKFNFQVKFFCLLQTQMETPTTTPQTSRERERENVHRLLLNLVKQSEQ